MIQKGGNAALPHEALTNVSVQTLPKGHHRHQYQHPEAYQVPAGPPDAGNPVYDSLTWWVVSKGIKEIVIPSAGGLALLDSAGKAAPQKPDHQNGDAAPSDTHHEGGHQPTKIAQMQASLPVIECYGLGPGKPRQEVGNGPTPWIRNKT